MTEDKLLAFASKRAALLNLSSAWGTDEDGVLLIQLIARIEALHEKLAAAYITLSGTDIHASDCATSNAPAYEPEPCNCKETAENFTRSDNV